MLADAIFLFVLICISVDMGTDLWREKKIWQNQYEMQLINESSFSAIYNNHNSL